MCSRFELNVTPRDLASALSLIHVPALPNRAEVRPTDTALIVKADGDPAVALAPWGFIVDWSKGPMINARSETLDQKPTFSPHLENRCIVPASAYFEWRIDEQGRKLKNRIHCPDQPVMTFAGLFDGQRFTIVTCQPAASISHVHDRMPVILDEDARSRWLDPAAGFKDVRQLLAPFAGSLAADEATPPAPPQGDLFG